jgi:hypothetical protein
MLSPDVIAYVWSRNPFCLANSDILLSVSCTLEIPLDSSQINNDPAICFDKVKNNLVVCNYNGTAFLYKVI